MAAVDALLWTCFWCDLLHKTIVIESLLALVNAFVKDAYLL